MPALPPRADLDQLRRLAKDRLRAARLLDPHLRLSTVQRGVAGDHGFPSWPALVLEVARRRVLDLRDPAALAQFLREHPEAATTEVRGWLDHPAGASPLGYLAMARYDTATRRWRDVWGAAAAAHVLLASGAAVDGDPGAPETPLITAASYGDAELASVLIAAGADLDAVAAPHAGGVPGGTALLHAAVFGMTDVLDVLVAAGARVRSLEEAAAAGDLSGWRLADLDGQVKLRALIMAADHQRVDVIDQLVAAGVPVDEADVVFGRHPLRLAAANGRPESVAALLTRGADPSRRDAAGRSPLELCRHARTQAPDPAAYDAVEALLTALCPTRRRGAHGRLTRRAGEGATPSLAPCGPSPPGAPPPRRVRG
jgi:uncharacterized protein